VDEANADEFCRRMWPRLAAAMGLICRDSAVGEEIAQEALVRVWARWDHVSTLDLPEAWAYRAGVNLARSHFRRIQAERRALARLEPARPVSTDRDDAMAVRLAVAALPERQRAALVLRYFADLPVDEVAAILDCAAGTVKSLTRHAIDNLRGEFSFDDSEEVPLA